MTDEEIRLHSIEFAKKNKKSIAQKLTDPALYAPEQYPVSVFMAGSPGAGKTEFSKGLIDSLEKNKEHRVFRIDGDEIRSLIPGYTGSNSRLFQGAISLVVEKIHDSLLHNKQNFVFDGTFSKYEKAQDNIRRSLDHKRIIFVFYIYQKPEIAWKFTQEREEKEGRNIPKAAFIEEFFSARESVNRIIDAYKDSIYVFLVKKDYSTNTVEYVKNLTLENKRIDDYIQDAYTKDVLEKTL